MSSKTVWRTLMRITHNAPVDLVSACRAFVSVVERGSFTSGAARLGISQSVVSRRIAALEGRLGGALLDRRGRRPTPTTLGDRVLPTARRLVSVADLLDLDAEDARLTAYELAVPPGWEVRDLAALDLAGRDHGLPVLTVEASAPQRVELVLTRKVHAAVTSRPAAEATWRIPLGVATATPHDSVHGLEHLKADRRRARVRAPRLWLLEEDDVPHVRDRIVGAAEAAGLAPSQVAVASSVGAAVAAVLSSSDLLLASEYEAERFDLAWSRLRAPEVSRGYVVTAGVATDAERVRAAVGAALAQALGAT